MRSKEFSLTSASGLLLDFLRSTYMVIFFFQEDRYEKLAVSLLSLVGGKGEKELNDTLSVAVAKEILV